MSMHSVSMDTVLNNIEYRSNRDKLMPFWAHMKSQKIVFQKTAEKAAGSGLVPNHLYLAYSRGGIEGINSLDPDRVCVALLLWTGGFACVSKKIVKK